MVTVDPYDPVDVLQAVDRYRTATAAYDADRLEADHGDLTAWWDARAALAHTVDRSSWTPLDDLERELVAVVRVVLIVLDAPQGPADQATGLDPADARALAHLLAYPADAAEHRDGWRHLHTPTGAGALRRLGLTADPTEDRVVIAYGRRVADAWLAHPRTPQTD